MKKIPIIDITDLYHPYQDPGDNFDLLSAYCLPEIDLRAVILDITEDFRKESIIHPIYGEIKGGPREAGIIPVIQCNYMFKRNVPYGIGPFRAMLCETDTMEDTPAFNNGIELFIKTLRESEEKLHVLSFGSARVIAAAFNREPELLMEKIEKIHLSAGSSGDYLEWNVALDKFAFIRVLRSGLPINIYPCATKDGPFSIGEYNTFWLLKDLRFINEMQAPLRRYLTYAFSRSERNDYLTYLDTEPENKELFKVIGTHNVWETAIWMNVAGRTLQINSRGFSYLPKENGTAALKEEMLPCKTEVGDNGIFNFTLTEENTPHFIYRRETPLELEDMLSSGLADLYLQYI